MSEEKKKELTDVGATPRVAQEIGAADPASKGMRVAFAEPEIGSPKVRLVDDGDGQLQSGAADCLGESQSDQAAGAAQAPAPSADSDDDRGKHTDSTEDPSVPLRAAGQDAALLSADALKLNPALLPAKVPSPFLEGLERFRVFCLKALVGLILFIVAATLFFALFSRQIISFADHELAKNPYIAIPLVKLTDPLYDSPKSVHDDYVKALNDAARGWANAGMLTYAPGVMSDNPFEKSLLRLQPHSVAQPLSGYVKLMLGLVELKRNGVGEHQKGIVHLTQAIDEISKQTSPDNFAVALADRELARSYLRSKIPGEAEKYAKAALAIDMRGLGADSWVVTQDQQALLAALTLQKDRTRADRAWTDYLDHVKRAFGEHSLDYGDALIVRATYMLDSGRCAQALEDARGGMEILRSSQDERGPSFSADTISFPWHSAESWNAKVLNFKVRALSTLSASPIFPHSQMFFNNVHKARLAPTSEVIAAGNGLLDLENQFLDWYKERRNMNHVSTRMYLAMVEQFADECRNAGKFERAQQLYLRALGEGARLGKVPPSRMNGYQSSNMMLSESYVRMMAKSARTAILKGDNKEGLTIANNCLNILDPYNSWRSLSDYSSAAEELVYAIGPLSGKDKSPEVQQAADKLVSILESKPFRGTYDKRFRGSTALLAEFYELQGDMDKAGKYYEAAAGRMTDAAAIGALAAFYDKQGRYAESGPLYFKAEKLFRAGHGGDPNYYKLTHEQQREIDRRNEGAEYINLGHLKRLMDSAKDQGYAADPDLNWAPIELEILSKVQTSYQIGVRFSVHDVRPVIKDFREDGAGPGTAYLVRSARKDFAKMTDAQRKEAREKFEWYSVCYPAPETHKVLKEAFPSRPLPGLQGRIRALSSLKPDEILIIDNSDADEMRKLVGGQLSRTELDPPMTMWTADRKAATNKL